MPQSCDMEQTALLPLWRKARWGIFRPKNPMASAGFEPANLCTRGQHVNHLHKPYIPNPCLRWRSWLRHCVASRKVAGSIPDSVTGIFHWHNPSGRTMALGLTQLLTELSTRNNSWGGKGGQWLGLTTLPPSSSDCLETWEPQTPGALWAYPGL
jgi:hypothetical protein